MKYISNNIFKDFEFHDATLKFISLENNTLVVSAKYLNIHKGTPQNLYKFDMEIAVAQITFNNFKFKTFEPGVAYKQDDNGEYYTEELQVIYKDEEAKERLLNELYDNVMVYEFGTLENGNYYLEGACNEPWFHAEFLFDSAVIEWDEFKKPAWYEEKPFNHDYRLSR